MDAQRERQAEATVQDETVVDGTSPDGLIKWNIFARVLEEILAAHDARIGQIDDRTPIYREKVARLQRSLSDSAHIHALNPAELEQVRRAFTLSDDEMLQLRAAVVAASIQKGLLDRISPEDARLAAEELYPGLVDSLRRRARAPRGVGQIRGDDGMLDAFPWGIRALEDD
jgi:hypothetical protein